MKKTLRLFFKKNNSRNLIKNEKKNEKKNMKYNFVTLVLPFIQGVIDKIARILRKKDIKTCFRPLSTINFFFLKLVKDPIDPHQF